MFHQMIRGALCRRARRDKLLGSILLTRSAYLGRMYLSPEEMEETITNRHPLTSPPENSSNLERRKTGA
jgi:hypothetical protein